MYLYRTLEGEHPLLKLLRRFTVSASIVLEIRSRRTLCTATNDCLAGRSGVAPDSHSTLGPAAN